jgi:hypothetical protein
LRKVEVLALDSLEQLLDVRSLAEMATSFKGHSRTLAQAACRSASYADDVESPPPDALTVAYDYNQLYLYDAAHELSTDGTDYLDALDAATREGLTVGAASGIVDVLMPRQENFAAKLEIGVTQGPPPVIDGADHVVEFDLASSGRIRLEGSGGSGEVEIDVSPGQYRARLSGFNFESAAAWSYDDTGDPADRYRLELWPVDEQAPPTELKRWPGYNDSM